MAHNERLSPRQERALAALLVETNVRSAANAANVPESSLWRWLGEPLFAEAYKKLRRECLRQATARLQNASTEAVNCLLAIVNDPTAPHAARASAARWVLEYAYRSSEQEDFQSRIEQLEQSVIFLSENGSGR